jgi:hypothetical protein
MTWRELLRFRAILLRLGGLPYRIIDVGSVVIRFDIVRLGPDAFRIIADCLVVLFQITVSVAPTTVGVVSTVECVDVFWLEPERFDIIADGFVVLLETVVGIAPPRVRDAIVWLMPDPLSIIRNCGLIVSVFGFLVRPLPITVYRFLSRRGDARGRRRGDSWGRSRRG